MFNWPELLVVQVSAVNWFDEAVCVSNFYNLCTALCNIWPVCVCTQFLQCVRTFKFYGYIVFKVCTADYPQPDTQVVVSAGNRELSFRFFLKVSFRAFRSIYSELFLLVLRRLCKMIFR